jgi:hypothetical protein
MEYLRGNLNSAFGASVASYSGEGGAFRSSNGWVPASKEAVTAALRAGTIKVLICTDAASEGLNLQAAGALVNFDLPWNPSNVEQRIGRVDRIGQEQPVLPIVNLYLQDSVDERVYRALATRCGLFETFVGPMQPVLSQAIRMLIGRDHVNVEALTKAAEAIRANPILMQAFPEDEPVALEAEEGLVRREHVDVLLSALEGTGLVVTPESNSVHRIGGGPVRIVTHPSEIVTNPNASCIDGLDARQWDILRELQQPGERLPLVLGSAEQGAFRVVAAGWVSPRGLEQVQSFADLQVLLTAWDGQEPPKGAWQAARLKLSAKAREHVTRRSARQAATEAAGRAAQVEAAQLRLVEELGRTLICFEPDTDDLNGKFHCLASERTATAERLQRVWARLEAYPVWDEFQIADLREYRATLSASQVKTRLTGRELDAALSDPRWAMQEVSLVKERH